MLFEIPSRPASPCMVPRAPAPSPVASAAASPLHRFVFSDYAIIEPITKRAAPLSDRTSDAVAPAPVPEVTALPPPMVPCTAPTTATNAAAAPEQSRPHHRRTRTPTQIARASLHAHILETSGPNVLALILQQEAEFAATLDFGCDSSAFSSSVATTTASADFDDDACALLSPHTAAAEAAEAAADATAKAAAARAKKAEATAAAAAVTAAKTFYLQTVNVINEDDDEDVDADGNPPAPAPTPIGADGASFVFPVDADIIHA